MSNNLFVGGQNIALKIPSEIFDVTVKFYSGILGLEIQEENSGCVKVRYGSIWLWLDRCDGIQQCEMRLELMTSNTAMASEHLRANSIPQCDDIEQLPPGYDGFWIRSPTGQIILVSAIGE